ncbi:MAG: hypothetical protein ACRC0G_06555, partial [Fusobacteriaceae bacterium]
EARKYFKDQVVLKKIVFLKEIDPLSVNVKEDGKCFINIFENVELTNFKENFFWLVDVSSLKKMNEFLQPLLQGIENL